MERGRVRRRLLSRRRCSQRNLVTTPPTTRSDGRIILFGRWIPDSTVSLKSIDLLRPAKNDLVVRVRSVGRLQAPKVDHTLNFERSPSTKFYGNDSNPN